MAAGIRARQRRRRIGRRRSGRRRRLTEAHSKRLVGSRPYVSIDADAAHRKRNVASGAHRSAADRKRNAAQRGARRSATSKADRTAECGATELKRNAAERSVCVRITSGRPFIRGHVRVRLRALSADPPRELDVLRHDGHPLRVDGTQVGVLEGAHQVRLGSLLQRAEGSALEPQVELKVLRNLAHEPLERQLPDEELGALLKTDLPERDGARAVPVRLLHAPSRGRTLTSSLRRQLLPGAFPPVLLRAVCFVRAISGKNYGEKKRRERPDSLKIIEIILNGCL